MATVPSNLIPARITQLPEAPVADPAGYFPIVIAGTTYKVQFSQIQGNVQVPASRQVIAGTGLTGGGALSQNITIAVADGGIGNTQLDTTGVAAGTYGSASGIPVVTVNAKGRVTSLTTASIVISGYVPDTRQIVTGSGIIGGGNLAQDLTLSIDYASSVPLAGGTAATGTSNKLAREDHVHPAVNLSDQTKTTGFLPMGRGGTGASLSPIAGAIVYSNGTNFDLTTVGQQDQVLSSNGTGAPTWRTLTGAGTVTSIDVSSTVSGVVFTGGPVTSIGTITMSGTLAISNGGTGASTASGARTNLGLGSIATQDASNVSISGGSITVTNVGATSGNIATLTSDSATLGNLTATSGTITTLEGNSWRTNNLQATSGTVTTLTSTSAGITTLSGTSWTVTNFRATSATIDNFTFTSSTVTRLTAISASISHLGVESESVTTLTAASAAITTLTGTSAQITTIGASSGNITQFQATSATISTLSGTSAQITTLSGGSFTATNLTATSGTVSTLKSASADITNLSVASLTVSSLSLSNATFTSATITTLKSTSADITNVSAASLSLLSALGVSSGGTGLSLTASNGQILIGNGNGYALSTLTAGSNVSITNATGSITIAATGDVVGPAGATSGAISLFDGASGKLLKNSVITINASGVISGVDTPNIGTDAANKQYVDNLVSTGIHIHTPVVLATSPGSSRTDTYNNGTAGVSATLTSVANGTLVIDGTVASSAIRVLIQDCSNPIGNGVYVVTNPGSGAAQYVMTRASDADTSGQQSTQSLDDGSYFFTTGGTTNKGAAWVNTNSGTIDFGSTSITFALFSNSQVYSAGNGLSLTATTFSLDTPVSLLNGGTGATTQSGARTALGLGTMAVQDASSVNITGGDVSVNSANITTLTGTTFGTTATTQLRGASANITTFTATSAEITNLSVSSLTVSSLSLSNATFTSATITTLTSTSAGIGTISGTSLQYGSANITTLTSGSATLTNLTSTSGTVTTLTSTSAGITTLSSGSLTATNLTATSGTITTLTATSAGITNLSVSSLTVSSLSLANASFTSATITTLNSTSATVTTVSGTTLGYTSGNITTLSSGSLTATNLTSTSGTVTTLAGTSASITNLSLGSLVISSTTLVTNLNADLLDGQHGSYYLNLANATGNLSGGTY